MDQEQTEYKKIIALEHFQKAYEHQMKGELEEAVTLYKKSIDTHPATTQRRIRIWTTDQFERVGKNRREAEDQYQLRYE